MKIHISAEQFEGVVKELNCAVLNVPSATESFTMKGGGTFVIKSGDTYILYVNYFGRVSSDNSENESPMYDEALFAQDLEEMFEVAKLAENTQTFSDVPDVTVAIGFLDDLNEWLNGEVDAITEGLVDVVNLSFISGESDEELSDSDWDI